MWLGVLCCVMLCVLQADEELREGKLRFRGGRAEGAGYDEPDEVRRGRDGPAVQPVHLLTALLAMCGSLRQP